MKKMKIALVHHHLRQGGVTRVMTEQASNLKEGARVLLVTGEPPDRALPVPMVTVPEIAYDRDRRDTAPPQVIAQRILQGIRSFWPGGADLLHFHNPLLGKNRDLIRTIKALVSLGTPLLLQVHDFAEDGRPGTYSREQYPADCHYAVINTRDYDILIRSGLKKHGLHYLPNAIRPLDAKANASLERETVLYPVRAIRRKNIGEAVFLSLFVPSGKRVGITLEPTGALDVRSYNGWMSFVRERNLHVAFRLGIGSEYPSVLARACCVITTSVKEGFGLAYLEPWTAHRMLSGRILRDICDDFLNKGLKLGHLYERLNIPVTFFDRKRFEKKWIRCYREKMSYYGRGISKVDAARALEPLVWEGTVDFGVLSEDLQKEVIQRVFENEKNKRKILDLNSFLVNNSLFYGSEELIEYNRDIVRAEYSAPKNGQTLLGVYERVLSENVSHCIDKEVLLDAFITPEQNRLLLCDSGYE
jgi:glycosyltransferase involved in cell wall biosynthesis